MKILISGLIYLATFIPFNLLTAQSMVEFRGTKRADNFVSPYNFTQQIGTNTKGTLNTVNYIGVHSFPLDFSKSPYLRDTLLNYFEIGKIPEQTVQAGSVIKFYIKSDSLGLGVKNYSIQPDNSLTSKILFKPNQQYFEFKPDKNDTASFVVIFKAKKGNDSITQSVPFKIYRVNTIDKYSFGVSNGQVQPLENDKAYQFFSTIKATSPFFNGIANRPVRIISISAIELTLENQPGNFLMSFSGARDIQEINIYAERLFIRDTFNLPQTRVNIYCKEIIFEDLPARPRASINTTPIAPVAAPPGVQGVSGANAGSINLYAGRMIDNFGGFRFRLIGGDGQNSTDAVSGSGGDGGILYTNLDIENKVDLIGGISGIPAGSGTYPSKVKGHFGKVVKDSIQLRWIHPNYIRQVIAYCDDAYFLGYGANLLPRLLSYDLVISGFSKTKDFEQLDTIVQSDLLQAQMEIISLGNRILSGLDYFGNPPGWVPMLSFELTQAAFETELSNAIRIIYLNSFLNASADSIQKMLNGFNELRDNLKVQGQSLENEMNYLSQVKIVEIETKLDENEKEIENITNKIKLAAADLERRAQAKLDDSKKLSWTKVVGLIGKVATLIPEPTIQTIGAGLTAATQFYDGIKDVDNFNISNITRIIDAGKSAVETYNSYQKKFEATQNDWKGISNQWKDFFPVFQGGIDSLPSQIKKGSALFSSLNNKFEEVKNIYNSYLGTPDGDLKKIRSELMATDPELPKLNEDLVRASENQKKLVDEFNSTNEQIQKIASEVVANALMFDNINTKINTNTFALDHRTVHYLNYLKFNAVRRLKMYHYFMAKAWEFRRLQPYTGNLNITAVFNAAENMVQTANNSVLSASQYEALASVYRDQISQIAEGVYVEYTSNFPPLRKTNRSFRLPKDLIERINNGEQVKVNLSKIGVFNDNEENIRIAAVRVSYLKDRTSSNFSAGTSPEINVKFTYPNLSTIKYRGKVYHFNNYNLKTNSPLQWSTSYDKLSGSLNQVVPSPAAQSLLRSLLVYKNVSFNNSGLYMFSQPSADAELILSANFNNAGFGATGRLFIDSIVFQIDYDYNEELSTDSYLQISSEPNWIVPTYLLSRVDKNSMQNGQADMIRVFQKSSTTMVNVRTDQRIGGYKFERWLDKFGNPIMDADSTNPSRTFRMSSSIYNKAKYTWAGPVLNVPDTIYFTQNTTSSTLRIRNNGSGPMDWVIDTISSESWINFGAAKSGVNNLDIPVSVNVPQSVASRFGYIIVIAPEAENAIDTVWISYKNNLVTSIPSIYDNNQLVISPNPSNGFFLLKTNSYFEKDVLIYAMNGIIVLKDKMFMSKSINISTLPKGTYIVLIRSRQNGIQTTRRITIL